MIGVAAFLIGQVGSATDDLPQLISQIRYAYRTCKNYRDAGTQTIWRLDKSGKREMWGEWRFSTVFLRPGQIRCEVSEPSKDGKHRITSVLWTVKEPRHKTAPLGDPSQPTPYAIRIYIGLDGSTQTTGDFVVGMSSFASVCFGGIDKVPLMLLPSDIVLDFLAQKDLCLVGSEKLGRRACSVLSSKELATKLWFDKRTGLLIKLQETNDFGDGRSSVRVIQYSPKVNALVSQSEFKGPQAGPTMGVTAKKAEAQ